METPIPSSIIIKKSQDNSFFFTKDISSTYRDGISIEGPSPKYYEDEIDVLQIMVINEKKVLVEAIKKLHNK